MTIPTCPRCKRPTPITVGDGSGPTGCRACHDLPTPPAGAETVRQYQDRGRR